MQFIAFVQVQLGRWVVWKRAGIVLRILETILDILQVWHPEARDIACPFLLSWSFAVWIHNSKVFVRVVRKGLVISDYRRSVLLLWSRYWMLVWSLTHLWKLQLFLRLSRSRPHLIHRGLANQSIVFLGFLWLLLFGLCLLFVFDQADVFCFDGFKFKRTFVLSP